VNLSGETPGTTLAELDAFLWEAASHDGDRAPSDLIREGTVAAQSPVTTWTLIDEPLPAGAGAFDRLAAMPGVVEARWFTEGRAFLNADHQGAFVFVALPTLHEGVVQLVGGLPATDDRWKRLRRWVRRRVSALSPVFLNEEDFLSLGDALAEHGSVEASRMTARDLADGSSYTRGWPEHKRHPRPSHREALAEAQKLAVRTLTLHVSDRLLVQLRRDAGATFYSGDYRLFEAVVLAGMALAASRRRTLLSGRQRQVHEPAPRPLAVRTRGGTFGHAEAIVELLDTLEHLQDTGVAVFHRNPYLHAAVTDYSDGSSFDVFVNDADELVVIPGYRATLGALARLTDSVGERFAAVEVTEVEVPVAPALKDLLGDG
jgi:hypothetical protein